MFGQSKINYRQSVAYGFKTETWLILTDKSYQRSGSIANCKTILYQVTALSIMKKGLMLDLQKLCKSIEFEISLDKTRERYNTRLRLSTKEITYLERNLEQLSHVQQLLVEQNASLKKKDAIAERNGTGATTRRRKGLGKREIKGKGNGARNCTKISHP
jgi:hypothetical protein